MRAYTADMIPGGASPVINVSQYDNDYAVTVTLIEGAEIYTPPSGATIMVEGTKPDGHGFEYACTYQGNVVTMPIYTQMTAVAGRFPIELVVYQSGLRVGSCNIIFAVERAPLGEGTDISETVIPDIIAGAQAQADAAAASATQAASSAASAETAKDAAMDAAQDAIDAAQELQTAIQFNAALIHETASGAVASFADGADDIPMKSLVAEITPVQDLNGYDKPWPGGGGKNLLENTAQTVTQSGVTFTVNEDGTVSTSGTSTRTPNYIVYGVFTLKAGTYIFSGCPSGGSSSTYYQRINYGSTASSTASVRVATDTGSGATFTLAEDSEICVWMDVDNGADVSGKVFKPMIRLSSISDDTYAPYSNICPISGRTGMTVTASGRNLLPKNTTPNPTTSNGITFTYNEDGSITADGTATGVAMSRAVSFRLPYGRYRKPERTFVQYKDASWRTVRGGGYLSTVMEIDEDYELACRINISIGMTVNNVTYYPYVYLESDTNTEYEPYVGTSYPVTWETEAGMVYGGALDVVSGVLTVDKYLLTCGETITPTGGNYWYGTNPNRWQIVLADNYMPDTDKMGESISDAFGYYDGGLSQWTDGTFRFSGIQSDGHRFMQFKWDGQPTTVEDLKAFLAENPIHFVIPLATPQTYQLTPTEVRTLLGGNTIYTDAGDVSVEYIADTKMYIDNKIAELQALVLEN